MEQMTLKSRWSRYLPIIFFEVYLSGTVLLFAFGPWDWGIDNPRVLYPYLIGSQIVLFFGYICGFYFRSSRSVKKVPTGLIKVSIILNLLIAIPLIYVRSGGNFSFIIQGFINPGLVYELSREAELPYNITDYVNIVISPITWPLVPWIIYYWKSLSKNVRIWGIFGIIAGTIIPYVASGTNKGLFDILFVSIGIVFFPYLFRHTKIKDYINSKTIKYSLVFLLSFVLLSAYFANNIVQRLGSEDYLERISVNIRADNATVKDSFLEKNISPDVKGALIAMTNYISQGYYGCSLALKEEFVPTYGLGNSRFFSWLVGDLVFGQDIQKNTYPMRVSEKTFWDADITWSSIYPWFASDFTFIGTYLIVFLVGLLLARSWISMNNCHDPWAIVIFSLLCIMLFYFSANNQIFQTGPTFVTFFAALLLWRFPIRVRLKK